MNGTIYCRKGMWYVNAVIDGRRNRRSLGTRSETRARLLLASLIPRCSETETLLPEEPVIARRLPFLPGVRARNRWNGVMTRAALQRTGWLPKLYRRMMARCAIKGWVSDVTMEDLIGVLWDSGGRCAISGIEFTWDREPWWQSAPFSPSVDRIECTRGYTKDNIRIVCTCVNAARRDWGDAVLLKMSQAIVAAPQVRHAVTPECGGVVGGDVS